MSPQIILHKTALHTTQTISNGVVLDEPAADDVLVGEVVHPTCDVCQMKENDEQNRTYPACCRYMSDNGQIAVAKGNFMDAHLLGRKVV